MPIRRVAVLSDVHANWLALQAVLADLDAQRPPLDGVWFLGDMVGRGPQPLPVAARLKALYDTLSPLDQSHWLVGNHDLMVLGDISLDTVFDANIAGMAKDATTMARHNRQHLQAQPQGRALLDWLATLPTYTRSEAYTGVYLAHGAYAYDDDGLHYESSYGYYVQEIGHVSQQIKAITRHEAEAPRLILNGHTHVPLLAYKPIDKRSAAHLPTDAPLEQYTALQTEPLYLNPGSVGFPRGDDRTPSYAILELDADTSGFLQAVSIAIRRVPYDWRPYFEAHNPQYGHMARDDYPPAYQAEVQTHRRPSSAAQPYKKEG